MRVITGTARGTKLITPEGNDIRPTSEMAKEAIFSILQNDIPGARVLDLFAGSGQLGIEALSRGASFCVFVDKSRTAQEIVRENLKKTKLTEKSRAVIMDYASFLAGSKDKFDIALLDPPYSNEILDDALPKLVPLMNDSGVILCEMDKTDEIMHRVGDFELFREYRYGKAKIVVFRKREVE